MKSSSKYLNELRLAGGVARRVRFDLVVARDFYDGPETGFAFYSSGEALSFSAIAEAQYPILRAFAFILLDGNWAQMVDRVVENSARPPNSRMVFASKDDSAIATLLGGVSEAATQSYYIGVGNAFLDDMAVMAVSESQLDYLKNLPPEPRYSVIHRFIKEAEARGMRNS